MLKYVGECKMEVTYGIFSFFVWVRFHECSLVVCDYPKKVYQKVKKGALWSGKMLQEVLLK